jgi:beta-carotene ketolase (CrtW type)
LIGLGLIAAWLVSTRTLISLQSLPPWWATGLLVLLQTHLYTGMFITAHDAMHGLVSPSRAVNDWIGRVAALLFAFNWFDRMRPKHHAHHDHVATDEDPDWAPKHFLGWYLKFALEYVTWWQILAMAVTYNLLKLAFPAETIIAFWIVPSLLATLQLFIFGTYLPHRGEHAADDPYKARSQYIGHLGAFLACYFFGYHYEHHAKPYVPWWRLWQVVDRRRAQAQHNQ